MEKQKIIYRALDREKQYFSAVHPQYSYYERLAKIASENSDELDRIAAHIEYNGGFRGL